MTVLSDPKHPLQPLVQRTRDHTAAVMRRLAMGAGPAEGRALAKELVLAHACFVDLLAADYQIEHVQPLVDSTKAVMDALVVADIGAFKSACESMRLSLIAWEDRNGWNGPLSADPLLRRSA